MMVPTFESNIPYASDSCSSVVEKFLNSRPPSCRSSGKGGGQKRMAAAARVTMRKAVQVVCASHASFHLPGNRTLLPVLSGLPSSSSRFTKVATHMFTHSLHTMGASRGHIVRGHKHRLVITIHPFHIQHSVCQTDSRRNFSQLRAADSPTHADTPSLRSSSPFYIVHYLRLIRESPIHSVEFAVRGLRPRAFHWR